MIKKVPQSGKNNTKVIKPVVSILILMFTILGFYTSGNATVASYYITSASVHSTYCISSTSYKMTMYNETVKNVYLKVDCGL